MVKRKKVVGIEIDEILRAKWLQFDKYYVEEFGITGVPEGEPYVFDYFNTYKWSGKTETEKELREDAPDNINPIYYKIDSVDGKAPADAFLFKNGETIHLTPKEVYNRFMYEDYLFEIHGAATMMYKGMDVNISAFLKKYDDVANFVVLSKENVFSIPPTLFFLSKITSKFKTYKFVDNYEDMLDAVDILITTNPELISNKLAKNKVIKLKRPYNEKIIDYSIKFKEELLQLNDLLNNSHFEKIIKYNKK